MLSRCCYANPGQLLLASRDCFVAGLPLALAESSHKERDAGTWQALRDSGKRTMRIEVTCTNRYSAIAMINK